MPNDLTLAFGAAGVAARDCRPTPACDPRPVCPACGGLECLCRPRFFAGQLLTEEDLNRLDHYIVAKNRLHNRHLFGTGVVCGLDVVCGTCDPAGGSGVIVRPGYALSPCGNDIVVCRDEVVDICDLINRCRPRRDDCVQPGHSGPAPDDEHHTAQSEEEWVLAICYQEKPSRGVTALRGASCSCGGRGSCGCGCGVGHGHDSSKPSVGTSEASCGCGGGGGKLARTKSAVKAGVRPPQCEPTLTCEGYSFAVYKPPRAERGRQADPGPLIKRFICCLVPLFEQLTKLPAGQVTSQQMYDWLVNFIEAVREFLVDEGLYDCDAVRKLNAVVVPVPTGPLPQYMHAWSAAFVQVLEVLSAVFQKCLCSALLPPCPGPELNDCVPIATVTVMRDRCRVRHICNASHRKFLVTWPSVQYWLSWLPLFSSWVPAGTTLRKLLEAMCCTPVRTAFEAITAGDVNLRPARRAPHTAAGDAGGAAPPAADAASAAAGRHPFVQLLAESIVEGTKLDAGSLLLAGLGATRKDGGPLASDVDLQYPGQALLVHQVIGPAVAPLVPLLSALGPGAADTSALQRELETLRRTVEKQQTAIEELQRR